MDLFLEKVASNGLKHVHVFSELGYPSPIGRRLLEDNATTHNLPIWEQCDAENATGVAGVFVFIYILLILVIFVALAIVCDDFFVPSLEAISEKLKLSEDVAGATFMAAGSSAPELFTSVAGVAFETDVGVGTIVGSAVFNILIIIALTAALAGQVLHLDWRPLARDCFCYAVSIGCFIYFSWDGVFYIWEAVILLVLYILYIVLMVFNTRLMDFMAKWRCICCKKTEVLPVDAEAGHDGKSPDGITDQTDVEHIANGGSQIQKEDSKAPKQMVSFTGGHARRLSLISQRSGQDIPHSSYFHHQRGSIMGALHPSKMPNTIGLRQIVSIPSAITDKDEETTSKDGKEEEANTEAEEAEEEAEETINLCPCLPCCPRVRTYPPQRGGPGCWETCKLILRWVIFVVSFPFVVLFSWTIPDCSKEHNRKWFLLSFIMSVLWIMILSFAMVLLVGRTGCMLYIDTFVMGLVIIAIGTSVPDALSSILVARDGYGDMAVSNAIGSNVFDINLGIGLPFMITIAIRGPVNLLRGEELIAYADGSMVITPHAKFGFILLFILFMCILIFGIAKFRLTKLIGISFVVIYIMFLIYAFVQELVCNYNC